MKKAFMTSKFRHISFFILSFLLMFSLSTQAQDEVLSNAKLFLKNGSAKELSRHFSDIVELSFDGAKATYSKTQAEFVLKDFFRKYPPANFDYIHQGSSKEGLKYAIGKYSFNGGNFRVYMLIKKINGNYIIDTLEFSKE
jgi:hypothetical protein